MHLNAFMLVLRDYLKHSIIVSGENILIEAIVLELSDDKAYTQTLSISL